MTPKNELRRSLLAQRQAIPLSRRTEASRLLKENFSSRGCILSFSSFSTEIDTSLLNAALAKAKSLFLPRLENSQLVFYHVEDAKHLALSPYGIFEPHPAACRQASFSEIDCILVPGLGFDRERFRIGYGKGHYDRFLAGCPVLSIGIGFKEQLIEGLLPRDPWDIPTSDLLLF